MLRCGGSTSTLGSTVLWRDTPRDCACVGDDTPDLALLRQAGFAVAVADANAEARRAAHRTTTLGGGQGAVREVCDWLLGARRVRKS